MPACHRAGTLALLVTGLSLSLPPHTLAAQTAPAQKTEPKTAQADAPKQTQTGTPQTSSKATDKQIPPANGTSSTGAKDAGATAKDAGTAAKNTAATPADPAEYVLGADDVIELNVSHHPDLNRQMTILPDGKITLPDQGDFQASGKTRRELAAEIQTAYEKTLNNASVTIIVREVRSRKVGVTGAVHASGNFDLKQNWRLMDLIASAGGLTAKPNRIKGRLLRNLKTITLDVERANAKPDDDSANVVLQAGDIVLLDDLPPLRDEVSVLGQIAHIGTFPLDDQTTLITLITQAGGPTERAALTKAYVRRGNAQIPLNLRPSLALNQQDETITNFKLKAGDVLVIPEIEKRYAVMGQVAHPSYYPIPEKGPVNVFEAFNFAGGQLPSGDLSKAGIIRMVDGKPTVIPVNMNNILKKPETAMNLTLQPEDVLVVPLRGQRGLTIQDALSPLSILSLFGLRFF